MIKLSENCFLEWSGRGRDPENRGPYKKQFSDNFKNE